MAFFLEATFVGLMFFGWDKLSKRQHLFTTFMVALGSNLSALWILVANGWMQHPVGSRFNPDTMRMEVTDFMAVLFNPVAQAKFVHTVSAGYVTASVFVLGVSAWYLLKGKWVAVAKRSFTVAAAFGLASSLSVVVLGDESGYALTDNQKMKLASLEAMWHTEPAPAGIAIFGIPSLEGRDTRYEIKIPYVLGLISTRSLTGQVEGITELVAKAQGRIENGIRAYDAVEKLKVDRTDMIAREQFERHKLDLGYAMLLKRYVADPRAATPDQIVQAAWSTVPNVPVMFWVFRVMAGLGFFFIAFFGAAFYMASIRRFGCDNGFCRLFMRAAVWIIPLPWLAAEFGWVLAEIGRQPWAIEGILPTFLGASSLTVGQLWTTIIGFTLLYGTLAVIEVRLMLAAIRKGPTDHEDERSDAAVAGHGYMPLPAE